MNPFVILAIGIAFVIVAITILRLHAFVALVLAAVLVGVLPAEIRLPAEAPDALKSLGDHQPLQALRTATHELGSLVARIGLVIVLASIIGQCMMDSGAADRITRRFLRLLGEKRSPLALLGSGFVLSIPVFFDTVFYLLIPLAKAFRLRTGRNYLIYVMTICAGGVITHSLVAPTPGPLGMAEKLHLDLGLTIIVGILFGIPPAILGGWFFVKWLGSRIDIPLREIPGTSIADLEAIVRRPDHELPPFWLSILPVVLPVVLISSFTVVGAIHVPDPATGPPAVYEVFRFLGDPNVALFLSTAIAIGILMKAKAIGLSKLNSIIEPAITSAGVIILITAAGGAFGKMLEYAGIGKAFEALGAGSGIALILVSFGIAAIMKVAQGSGTVSMLTTSGIVFGMIRGTALADLPFHPIYLFVAIGFGSLMVSWMNDSGFWIVCKLSGFTEKETLRTWTPLLVVIALIGLVEVLIVSALLPLKSLPWTPPAAG